MMFHRMLICAFVVAAAPIQSLSAASIELRQLSIEHYGMGGAEIIAEPLSDWGDVRLTFEGFSSVRYFNLAVDNVWRVVNMPVGAPYGVGATGALVFDYGLGNAVGTRVDSAIYGFSITDIPALVAPAAIGSIDIGMHQTAFGYAAGTETAPPPIPVAPGVPPAGNEGDTVVDSAEHENFTNQNCATNWCVPTSISNSIRWLNKKGKLGISDTETSPAVLAGRFKQQAGKTVIVETAISEKEKYIKEKGWNIKTEVIEIGSISKIMVIIPLTHV